MLMNKLISNSNRTKLSAILLLPLGPSLHGTISNVVSSEDMVLVSRTTRSELTYTGLSQTTSQLP